MICQECCQIRNSDVKCRCDDGTIGIRYIGLAKGCISFANNIRCKEVCQLDSVVCKKHYKINISNDEKFVELLFSSKK